MDLVCAATRATFARDRNDEVAYAQHMAAADKARAQLRGCLQAHREAS